MKILWSIVKQDILDEINRLHSIKGLASIPKTSFYGLIEQYMASMHPGDRKELKWFVGKKIMRSNNFCTA